MWVDGRRGWRTRLRDAMRGVESPVVWFHCASLGEFEQGRPLMEAFLQEHPEWQLVVSFFSPSGYNVRQNYPLAHHVCYLPLDTKRNMRRFISLLRPSAAVFVKYELWYNTLQILHRSSTPTFLISARFRPHQLFFKPYGRFYRKWLNLFTRIFVQDDSSLTLLREHGIHHAIQSGDTRFDTVQQAVDKAPKLSLIETFAAEGFLFVAGSTWPTDEAMLRRLIPHLPSEWKFILVPHEIHRPRIDEWCERLGEPVLRYTQLAEGDSLSSSRILVVDTVGLLLSTYRYASLAYVGGGFGSGIHNTLEPAAFGAPVLFGPHHESFREALGLKATGGGVSVRTEEELHRIALHLMADAEERNRMGVVARKYVEQHTGATAIVMENVTPFIARATGERRH